MRIALLDGDGDFYFEILQRLGVACLRAILDGVWFDSEDLDGNAGDLACVGKAAAEAPQRAKS